jgi:ribonuclease J
MPLGGVGEVGKNLYVIEQEGRLLVIDCGVTFPTPDQMGVDLVLPDFTFLRRRAGDVEAIVVTHGHEDHIGAVPYLIREIGHRPVIGPRFALGLVRGKLDEHRLMAGADLQEAVADGTVRTVGPFEISFVNMTHSIPDCMAVVLHTPLGTLVHTGDFKFDPAPIAGPPPDVPALSRLGDEGVLLLLSDSTNAEVPAALRLERSVGTELRRVMATATGRVVVTTFASHVHRMQQVIDAAWADGRVVALVGRSMNRNFNVAQNLGYITVPDGAIVRPKDLDRHPADEQVILSTGSQGEPLSALRRMAHGAHPLVTIRPGDTVVFSSRTVPGNELAVNETVNRLARAGAIIVTQESNPGIHVSGHGTAPDLLRMLELVRPRYLAPIHGEFRQQRAHAQLAELLGIGSERVFIMDNGDTLELLDGGAARRGEPVPAGLTYVDGLSVADVGEGVIRDRRHLSEDGLVLLVATVGARGGELVGEPDVVTRGFGVGDEELLAEIRGEVERTLEASAAESITEVDLLQRQLHDAVAGLLYKRTKQRPVILPVVVEV